MQIPLPRLPVGLLGTRPCRPTELTHPVIRWVGTISSATVTEHVTISDGGPWRGRQRILEPRVLIGGVIGDEVEQNAKTQVMRLDNQCFGLGQGTEYGVDVAVVRDVVAGILHR